MSYDLGNYVNNKVRDLVLLFLTVLQLHIRKRRMWFPKDFISALDKIGMDVKYQSADFLFIFSRLWYTHVIRIRGCD